MGPFLEAGTAEGGLNLDFAQVQEVPIGSGWRCAVIGLLFLIARFWAAESFFNERGTFSWTKVELEAVAECAVPGYIPEVRR